MKIAIMGAGITGAYLYRLLDKKRHLIDVFDKKPETRCGIKPCAWGTSRGYAELVQAAGLDPNNYVLRKTDHVNIDGLRIKADLMTIDKARLIRDLLAGKEIGYTAPEIAGYDRFIDATGAARAFLPPLPDDLVLKCTQQRILADTPWENRVQLGKIGYAWSFPLADREHHIGCGSLMADPAKLLAELDWIKDKPAHRQCSCQSTIRLNAPRYSQPFVASGDASEIWGIGEAIGCVSPLAGDGIVPGMVSARLLLASWHDPAGYTQAVLKEFQWMDKERQVLDKLRNSRGLSLGDAWVLKKNARRMGMQVGLKEAAVLLRHLR